MPPPTSTSTPLPSQRTFIASLLSQLSSPPTAPHSPINTTSPSTTTNPLTSPSAPASLKPLFLTLHCLFPTDLLPALDLLDRGLITRFILDHQPAASGAKNAVYYVRSSQRSRGYKHGNNDGLEGSTSYEVRLKAWNCTCAAYAFAAFNSSAPRLPPTNEGADEMRFGGLLLGDEVPVCKHLLACVLVERMGGYVEERVVGREEMAGWAAGWGG